tara:strand:+ start:11658 stop:12017 length:360 start_codon:yes stop_codon:yes gene_type:complete
MLGSTTQMANTSQTIKDMVKANKQINTEEEDRLEEEQLKKEAEANKPTYFKPNPNNYSFEGRNLGASIGIIASLGYSFKTKSGFLKGLGYWLLGSIVVGGLGYGVGTLIKKKSIEKDSK